MTETFHAAHPEYLLPHGRQGIDALLYIIVHFFVLQLLIRQVDHLLHIIFRIEGGFSQFFPNCRDDMIPVEDEEVTFEMFNGR